ncbi:unnamed protein product, partial [Ectocarpus sp. 12 AP-2014]
IQYDGPCTLRQTKTEEAPANKLGLATNGEAGRKTIPYRIPFPAVNHSVCCLWHTLPQTRINRVIFSTISRTMTVPCTRKRLCSFLPFRTYRCHRTGVRSLSTVKWPV